MKKLFSILLFVAFVLVSQKGFTQEKIKVFNATTVVGVINERIAKIKYFTGTFVYKFNNRSYKGTIQYKSPDKFAMNYYNKNKILSNGKYLWIVFEPQKIAVKEVLDKAKLNPMAGWNIKRLRREYLPTFPKSGGRVTYLGKEHYKIRWIPKNNTAGFRYIDMVVSKDGYIRKVRADNSLGKTIELAITYGTINKPMSDDNFSFEPDEDTQMYENILIPEDNKEQ